MAEKSRSSETPVELRQKIASSRELVAREMGGLRYELNFPLKLKKAFQRHTVVFVGAALALGCWWHCCARGRRRFTSAPWQKVRSPNKTLLDSGRLLGSVKLAMTLVQPMVVSYFAKKGAKKGDQSRGEKKREGEFK